MQASTRFVVSGLLLLTACGPKGSSGPAARAPTRPQAVRVQAVREGPIVEGRDHLGEVVPARTVRVLARVAGTISSLGAPAGGFSPRGEVVARIAAPEVTARLGRVRAERRRAEGERDFACKQLQTDRSLASSGDLSRTGLERSQKACTSARLATKAARAAEREVEVVGTRATETTPFEGQVLTYLVDEGQSVMPGTPLATFGSTRRKLRLRLVARDLDAIHLGTRVRSAAGEGQVVEIGAQPSGPGRLYEVLVSLPERASPRIGENIMATLVLDEREVAVAVPRTALVRDRHGTHVVVERNGHLRRVEVSTGPREAGWVAIEPPLPAGTRVVTSAPEALDLDQPALALAQTEVAP